MAPCPDPVGFHGSFRGAWSHARSPVLGPQELDGWDLMACGSAQEETQGTRRIGEAEKGTRACVWGCSRIRLQGLESARWLAVREFNLVARKHRGSGGPKFRNPGPGRQVEGR
ncbi:MAG: hypothetical protein GX625_22090 [Clostridiaceae bacterium]|nr:hypothetical protein [Clostridiaceae bacterium]